MIIVLEEMNFMWNESDVEIFRTMWARGECITNIAEVLKRDTDEVALLVMDQKRKRKIKIRAGGVLGKT